MVATRIVSIAFNTTTNIIDKYAVASKKVLKPTLGPDRDQCAKIVPKKARLFAIKWAENNDLRVQNSIRIFLKKSQCVEFFQVGCDGGGGALGHPKVYINLDDGEPHGCIYCGLRFQLDPKAAAAAH